MENLYKKILEDLEYSFTTSDQDDPKTIEEALNSPNAERWKEAIEAKMGTIEKMGTWKLEKLLEDRETIGNKWGSKMKKEILSDSKLGLSHKVFLRNQA